MRLALVILIVLVGDARAEMWVSSMGELMHDAASIELVQVESVKDGIVTGTLVEAMRSKRTKGATVTSALMGLAKPVVGERVLIVCDSECPRAAGIVRDGWVQLKAQQPMDGAAVYPSVVVVSSIPALMAGKPAPNLCVRGTIVLADEPQRPKFEAQVSATDGKGKASVEKTSVATRVGAWRHRDEDVTVELGSLSISTRALERVGGCLEGELVPVGPIARTRKGLDRAIAGKLGTQVLGRGKLAVAKGRKLAAGNHAITFSVDADGQVLLASPLANGALTRIGYLDDKLQLGFSISRKSFYPELEFELVVGKGLPGGPAAQLAAALAKQRTVKVRVSHLDAGTAGRVTTPIGVMTLAYVPER